jgi:hypothetical protein
MKIQTKNQTSNRNRFLPVVLTAALLLLVGCVVTSVYPYYTDKDLVFDPTLLGKWVNMADTNQPPPFLRIEQVGDKVYRAIAFEQDETNSCEVHLFRLKQRLFLDSFPTNRDLNFVPVHQVSKVIRTEPTLDTADLNYDWLKTLLEKNPKAIRHLVLPDNPDDKQGRIVLTADTKELQRFVIKYLNDTNAWNKTDHWKRLD